MGVYSIPFQEGLGDVRNEWTKQVQVTKRPVLEAERNRRNMHYKKNVQRKTEEHASQSRSWAWEFK